MVKWTSGHVNKVAKWKKLDKGGQVVKMVMWIKWIFGQSGLVDASQEANWRV